MIEYCKNERNLEKKIIQDNDNNDNIVQNFNKFSKLSQEIESKKILLKTPDII